MNSQCYRVVFNENLGAWVAVDETVRARGKRSRGKVRRVAALLAALGMTGMVEAQTVRLPVESTAATRTASNFGSYSFDRSVANQLTINQASSTAIINWDSFNIDRGGRVHFAQPDANSRALNRIWDANPSEINGMLSANGHVYLVNRNGIRFGDGAQVDVGGLVASALNIRPDVFKNGFLSVSGKEAPFYFAGKLDALTGEVTDFDTPSTSVGGQPALVRNAGSLRASDGGSIMLFAPKVENAGRIETEGGQVVLAAGAKVYLTESGNTALRGMLVEVDPFSDGDKSSSTVSNTGLKEAMQGIIAKRGNITLAAMAVNNDGLLSVTTGKTENGSIYLQGRHTTSLLARGNLGGELEANTRKQAMATQGGEVVLGANSRIEAEVESITEAEVEVRASAQFKADPADSSDIQASKFKALKDLIRKQYTLTQADALKPSEVLVDGRTVLLKTGSQIKAPGGKVSLLAAGERAYEANRESVETYLSTAKADAGASVVMESGALVDVSGYRDVEVDGQRNQVSATLVSNELKDAPLQRAGVLYRKTVNFSRLDAPSGKLAVADASGVIAAIPESLRERAANAGSVEIQSAGDVRLEAGSQINVSGGSVSYTAADIVTTRLIAGSMQVDVDKASADVVYESLGSATRRVAAYAEGKNAGSVLVAARDAAVLEGDLLGQTVNGVYQTSSSTAAKGASFTLGDALGNFSKISEIYPQATSQLGRFDWGRSLVISDEPAPKDDDGRNHLSLNRLVRNGFSTLNLYAADMRLAADSPLSLLNASSLSLRALGDIDIDTDVRGAGMKFSAQSGRSGASFGTVRLAAGRTLDASGLWINDWISQRQGAAKFEGIRQIDAGSVTLGFNSTSALDTARVELGTGSRIDVSGGGSLSASGSLKTGNAGSITLAAGGGLEMRDASLRAEALAENKQSGKGGTLSIVVPGIRIDDAAQSDADLMLGSALFRQSGFAAYALTANSLNAGIGSGAVLDMRRSVRQLTGDYRRAATGSALSQLGRLGKLDPSVKDPVNFTLSASFQNSQTTGFDNGVLKIAEGARIDAGTGGSITLNAGRQLTLDGQLVAGGGSVALNMIRPNPADAPGEFDDQSIFLSDTALIDVAGRTLATQNARGQRSAEVLSGGSVSIDAAKGRIVAKQGARVLLDGTSATVDDLNTRRAVNMASDAGSLSLKSPVGILFGAQVSAKGGSSTAAGGSFSLDQTLGEDSQFATGTLREVIIGEGLLASGSLLDAQLRALKAGNSLGLVFADKPQSWVDSKSLERAGFDNLAIRSDDKISFANDVKMVATRQISLSARSLDVSASNASLAAAVIRLGWKGHNNQPNFQDLGVESPAAGLGSLTASAEHIDLYGGTSVAGARKTVLDSRGDVRLTGVAQLSSGSAKVPNPEYNSGSFSVSGNLDIKAAQIYAASSSNFTVSLAPAQDGEGGTLNIISNGKAPHMPLSAGSRMVMEADTINQGGVLRAPFGTIELNAREQLNLQKDSLTSASGAGAVIPYGELINGTDWTVTPTGNSPRIITQAPTPSIALRGPVVEQAAGAKVDVSGGGDLQALEFVPGAGGSSNVLEQANTYAIIPGYKNAYVPEAAGFDQQIGTLITLGTATYALLPARYAMLPGAYRVTLLKGYADAPANLNIPQALGGAIVSGRLSVANTSISSAQKVGVLVESVGVTRQRSEFTDARASTFFETQAARQERTLNHATADAGQLILAASERIRLEGDVNLASLDDGKPRRGGLVDISLLKSTFDADGKPAGSILVGEGENPSGLQIGESEIARLGGESVLIGGERQISSEGASINVIARDVRYSGSNGLQNATGKTPAEIIVAASNAVTVAAGAQIAAAGAQAGRPTSLQASVKGDGALLRVAADNTVIERTGAVGDQGTLVLESGAALKGDSVQADATRDSQLAPDVAVNARAFTLGARAISLGNGSASTSGTRLTDALLRSVAGSAEDITLRSYGGIRFDEDFELGKASPLKQLTLDAASLEWAGNGPGKVDINARSLTLSNSTGETAGASTGEGHLQLSAGGRSGEGSEAGVLKIGKGDMALKGFADTQLSATRGVLFSGTGTTTATGPVTVESPVLTVSAGANHALKSGAALQLNAGAASSDALPAGGGGKLQLEGSRVDLATQIVNRSGSVGVKASSGNLVLSDGARIDVSSRETLFGSTSVTTDAGRIVLDATQGNIELQTGGELDLRGRGDSKAGSLSLSASQGEVQLAGSLKATAGSVVAGDAGKAGKLSVDAGRNADVNAMIRATQEFEAQRVFRQRSGDMTLTENLKAQAIGLYTDAGSIRVDSRLDARGASGGSIDLAARAALVTQTDGSVAVQGGQIELGSSALLDASATAEGGEGGRVTLSVSGEAAQAKDGVTYVPEEQAGIRFASGSRIDVRGKGSGAAGSVTLNAPRTLNLAEYNPVLGTVAMVGEQSVFTVPVASTIDLTPQLALPTLGLPLAGKVSRAFAVTDASISFTGTEDGTVVDFVAELNNTRLSATTGTTFSLNGSKAYSIKVSATGSNAAPNQLRAGSAYRLKFKYNKSSPNSSFWYVDTTVSPLASPAAIAASNGISLLALAAGSGFTGVDQQVVYFTASTNDFAGESSNLGSGGIKLKTGLAGEPLNLYGADGQPLAAGSIVAGSAYAARYDAGSGRFTLLSSPGASETLRVASSAITSLPGEALAIRFTLGSSNRSDNVELQLNGYAAGRIYESNGITPVSAGSLVAGKSYTVSRLADGRYALRPKDGYGEVSVAAADDRLVAFTLNSTAGLVSGSTMKLVVNGAAALSLVDANGNALEASVLQAGRNYVASLESGRYRLLADDALVNSVAIVNQGVVLEGTSQVSVNAFKTYDSATLDSSLRDKVQAGSQQYAYWLPKIAAGLGSLNNGSLSVRPGVEIRSAGSLTLAEDWNLAATDTVGKFLWRYQDNSVGASLLIRTAGDLKLNAVLNDGFASSTAATPDSQADGWDLGLVAGADLTAANAYAVNAEGSGNLVVSKVVRTGTGDIRMAAAGDIDLSASGASVYSAGQGSGSSTGDLAQQSTADKAWLTRNGGDVRLEAGGDLIGRAVNAEPASWLWRTHVDKATSARSAATAVRFDLFNWVSGALGGGDVFLNAGGSIREMSVALPAQLAFGFDTSGKASSLDVLTSGSLYVQAGADIRGGSYLVENGQANLSAGGAVSAGSGEMRLYAADSRFAVSAASDLKLGSIQNSSMLNQIGSNATTGYAARWSSYTPDSALDLRSASGSVSLTGLDQSVLPSKLKAVALGGDIQVGSKSVELAMSPSATGQLELYAEGSIRDTRVSMVDADPAQVYSAHAPLQETYTGALGGTRGTRVRDSFNHAATLFKDNGVLAAGARSAASRLNGSLHEGDLQNAQVHARSGDVSGSFILAKAVDLSAGRDVKDLSLIAQNLDDSAVTSVSAGRDVVYSTLADVNLWKSTILVNGVLRPNITENKNPSIRIFGPGLLEVSAGRSVDLANSDGIISKGPGINSFLPDTGASIRVVAGKPADIDAAKFAVSYLDEASRPAFLALSKAEQLTRAAEILRQSFIQEYLGQGSAYLADWQAFAVANGVKAGDAAMNNPALAAEGVFDRFRYKVLWAELSASGQAGSRKAIDARDNPGKYPAEELTPEALYGQGFRAIELMGMGDLFRFNSSVRMLFSQIRSQSGGNVDVLVPGGSLDVGPTQLSDVDVSKQGLVANMGDSRVFVRDSLNVNTSRWFAIDGGNLLGWSSYGDIDAGKGSRTALAGSSQRLDVNRLTGKVVLVDGGASSGSGIATIFNRPITSGGDVEPYTPRGAVNAGEAGIRAAGEIPELPNLIGGDFVLSVGGGGAPAVPAVAAPALGTPARDNAAIDPDDAPATAAGTARQAGSVLTVEVVAGTESESLAPTAAGVSESKEEGDERKKREQGGKQ